MQAADKAEKLIKANFEILSTLILLNVSSSTSYLFSVDLQCLDQNTSIAKDDGFTLWQPFWQCCVAGG